MDRIEIGDPAGPALIGEAWPTPIEVELDRISGAYTRSAKYFGLHDHGAAFYRAADGLMIMHQEEVTELTTGR